MSKLKKLILSLSIVVTLAIAFVIGVIGNNRPSASKGQGGAVNTATAETEVNVNKVTKKQPPKLNFEPGEVVFQKGTDTLNYSYTPSAKEGEETTTKAKTVAYEYVFGNPMTKATAVNLKSIDTTAVSVTYAYSNTRLTETDGIKSEDDYTLQKLENKGDKVYIYVLVTPTNDNVPITFTKSIVWYYGIPREMEIVDNITGEVIGTQTIVSGQEIDKGTLKAPKAPIGYYFDAWYADPEFTQLLEGEDTISSGRKMYARFADCPVDALVWNGSGWTVDQYRMYELGLSSANVIPAKYDDGTNSGWVTTIGSVVELPEPIYGHASYVNLNPNTLPCGLTTINYYAFYGATINVDNLVIPASVTWIDSYAFYGIYNIEQITILSTNCYVASDAFEGASPNRVYDLSNSGIFSSNENIIVFNSLNDPRDVQIDGIRYCRNSSTDFVAYYIDDKTKTEYTLDSRTTKLGYELFKGCDNVTSIDLTPYTRLKTIGNLTFNNCKNLTNITLPNGLTSIGNHAFNGCSGLTSIELPDSLTSIGEYAFSYCSKLTSVDIPEGITTIPYQAFANCGKLKNVILPDSLTSIGNSAFGWCTGLTSLIIPKNVTSIGSGAFYDCYTKVVYNLASNLSVSGYFSYEAVIYTSLDDERDIVSEGVRYFQKSDTEFIAVGLADTTKQNIVLDSRTTSIASASFRDCESLISVDLSDCANLTAIGYDAFRGCSNLTSINFDGCSSLTDIAKGTFTACKSLESVDLSNLNLTLICESMFDQSGLISIKLPETITKIEKSAFSNCKRLESVVLPASLANMSGTHIFYECDNLTSVDFGACTNLTNINTITFRGCDSLTNVILPENLTSIGDSVFMSCKSLINITIPSTVKSIGPSAFSSCTGLTTLVIPASVTSINSSAFGSCYRLKVIYNLSDLVFEIGSTTYGGIAQYAVVVYESTNDTRDIVSEGIRYFNDTDNGEFIALGLEDNTKTTLKLDSRTTMVADWAFYSTNLVNVDLSGCVNLKSMGSNIFNISPNLTTVDLSGCTKLTSIGDRILNNCPSLTTVMLPESLITIGNYAFYSCKQLTSIDLSGCDELTSIGNFAFNTCESLASVELPDSLTTLGTNAFANCTSLTSVTLTKQSNLTSIGNDAFYNCSNLTSIVIPTSVTSIGTYAFSGCSRLVSIDLSGCDELISIGNYAFAGCYSLTTIVMPANVTSIGAYAFNNCVNLTSIDLTACDDLATIGEYAFLNCESLTSIIIPASVTSIGDYAFSGCTGLKTVYDLSTELEIVKGATDNGRVAYYAENVYNTLPTNEG